MDRQILCDNCKHCISVPWTDCAEGFECLVDVCTKKDPHFKYNLQNPFTDTVCGNFDEKPTKNS